MASSDKAKFTIYIPQELKEKFERLVSKRKRSLSGECEVMIEAAVIAAEESGELPKAEKLENRGIDYDFAVAIVKANSDNGQTRTLAVLETAQLLGIDGEKLLKACTKAGLKLKEVST